MDRTLRAEPGGMTAASLRSWGTFFLAVGIAGTTVLQRGILHMDGADNAGLLEALSSQGGMIAGTIALLCRCVYCCAAPIFAFLLVEGFLHTKNYKSYLLRILGLAALSEIPYDWAVSGRILELGKLNPVFGLALALVMLYFYGMYQQEGGKAKAIKLAVTLAAFFWASMLRIEEGAPLLLLTAIFWLFRNRPNYRGLAGGGLAFLCIVFSPYYIVAPMAFLAIHFYNGEPGEQNRLRNYLSFPILLVAMGLLCSLLPMLG